MVKMTIDGVEREVEPGLTVLQACEQAGIEIPRFCYHERLRIAGNCRMCLVSMERAPKPIASCAMPVGEGMVIHTDTPEVRAMRRGVMEFLLINHPLDCPICDQGGECDLQDQAMAYGDGKGRYREVKRAVEDKNLGPLIASTMTRCIHCTRCIRFITDIAGVEVLGATGRGEHMEVGTYVGAAIASELSGNLIDLCPVGALTSKPYAFNARPWELRKTESIDVLDAVGSNIRVDHRGTAVMRVLPRLNEDVNEEWISDKSRFACDGLANRRLDRPYVRRAGKLEEATWNEAFAAIAERLKGADGQRVAALAGDLADVEAMFALKSLMRGLGSPHTDCRQDGAALPPEARAGYLFNATIAGIDRADALLIVGANPRLEAPVLNARIRGRWLGRRLPIAAIGPEADLSYPVEWLGDGPGALVDLIGARGGFAGALRKADHPMMIIGQGALARTDGARVLGTARKAAEKFGVAGGASGWNGFSVLHTAAARVGGMEVGFVPGDGGFDTAGILTAAGAGAIDVVYLLGADEIDMGYFGDAFVIYQGHHGDAGAHRADVILPGAAYTEKDATYVNTEGRVQRANLAVQPPGQAREDWRILRALSEVLGQVLPFDNLEQLRQAIAEANPVLGAVNQITPATWTAFGDDAAPEAGAFAPAVENFYASDPISRASATMAECLAAFGTAPATGKTGTNG